MAESLGDRLFAARVKARDAARRQVQQWIYGPESNYPGDPRRRVVFDDWSVTAPFRAVQHHETDGHPITIGKWTGVNHTVVMLHGGMHRSDWVSCLHAYRMDSGEWTFAEGALHDKGPIVIGSDVLITYEALITSGVTIGHGAIIAPRAVVVKDVAPYEIVGGNPARHIKWRFDEPTREALLRIAWWDWPDEKVKALRHEIDSPDVQGFIERHDPLRQTN